MEQPDPTTPPDAPYAPRRPGLAAGGILSLFVFILSLPMFRGAFVAASYNDQYSTGYAFRVWAAHQWRTLGHVPLWNPEIYGGLPFVGGMHGDIFYPTAFLRLVLPTDVAMNLGFAVHYVLAGLFMYAFLRALRVSWTGAVIGGLAYQLTGVIGSYVSPGHDGKLFVSALLPLGALALTWAIRDRRWEGYAVFALSVGLALLSPHPQMAQYFLVALGIYALHLSIAQPDARTAGERLLPLGFALLAVGVGVGLAAIQYLPFYAYIPWSPRDAQVAHDFAWSATYALPWQHVPELFLSHFTGESFDGSYWGPNGIKLHSEYLGLPVLALAGLGAFDRERRREIYWIAGIAILFLLIAMGSATPFFRLWWSVVPFVKSTRAPGMALFVVAFAVAWLAGVGVARLERGEGKRFALIALVGGGVAAALGAIGVIGAVAESLAGGVDQALGQVGRASAARAAQGVYRWGAVASGLSLAAAGAIVWARTHRRLPVAAGAWLLSLVVGADLWWNAKTFWNYSHAPTELFAPDPIKSYLREQPRPFRVWNLLYPQSALMADNIAQWFGHHGNELHSFDVLHGRQGLDLTFTESRNPVLADLYAANYIIVPSRAAPDSLPGYESVLRDVPSSVGERATVFRRVPPVPYARLIPGGFRAEPEQIVATVRQPRFPARRVVLFDSSAAIDVPPLSDSLAAPLPDSLVRITHWEPGAMDIEITGWPEDGPPTAFLLVSENWYPDWRAQVDGTPTPAVKGDGALLSVPVPRDVRTVELRFVSDEYRTGKRMTWASLVAIALGLIIPPVRRRSRV